MPSITIAILNVTNLHYNLYHKETKKKNQIAKKLRISVIKKIPFTVCTGIQVDQAYKMTQIFQVWAYTCHTSRPSKTEQLEAQTRLCHLY